jgi:hypothetical protein
MGRRLRYGPPEHSYLGHGSLDAAARPKFLVQEHVVIDDLFLKVLPTNAGEELVDILMSRYEKHSSVITSNRPIEDWGKLLGDVVIVAPLLDRLYHHGHMLSFEGPSSVVLPHVISLPDASSGMLPKVAVCPAQVHS